MSDVVDKAQLVEEQLRADALARRRKPVILGDADQVVHPRDCLQCGDPIPMERLVRQPGAKRCTPCQGLYEKHGR